MNSVKNIRLKGKPSYRLLLAVLILFSLLRSDFVHASESDTTEESRGLKGPSNVENRISLDGLSKDTLFELESMKPYYEWKQEVLDEYNYAYGLDYYPIYMKASDSLPGEEDEAGSGVVRFYGFWQLYEGSDSTGTLVYLVEQRHGYTENLPQSFAIENTGYAGFSGIPFGKEGGLHLTNMYWSQEWKNGFGVAVGYLDITDFVDVYALTSPWTDFNNFVFSIGAATMDMPDDAALGFGGGGWLNDSVYFLAGMNDLNSDPNDPMEGFKTFSEDREYFKYAELGLTTSSKDQFYLDNLHLTYWHADKRDEGPIEEGWGTVLSLSQTLDHKWLVFARGGYAHDGGSLLERSVSIGGGYAPAGIGAPGTGHLLGFGANWGQPNDALFGANLKDQYAMEAYFRFQVTKEFAISPDVQLLIDPALNPDEDKVWIFGLKARLSL